MTLNNRIKCLVFLSLWILPILAFSQEPQDLIYIESDSVNYDYKKGIVNYEGKVHATQGITDLAAARMIVYYNSKHKIEKVIAFGKTHSPSTNTVSKAPFPLFPIPENSVATYKTLINDNKDILKAQARTIYYYPLVGKVILEKEAQVEYNQNQFSGPYIFYDMNKKVISSHPSKNSQSKLILEPIKQLKSNVK